MRRVLRLAVMDLGPVRRHRDFRLLVAGRGVSFLGSMVTYVAIPYQVYRLSGSSLLVGLLGLTELAPLLATAFLGGALADAFDRRRMVLVTELALAGASSVLLVNATLPSDMTPDTVTLEQALPLLDARAARGTGTRAKTPAKPRRAARKGAEKPKAAAKPKAAEKSVAPVPPAVGTAKKPARKAKAAP